jgi:mono/diheme cytochrome c family protein
MAAVMFSPARRCQSRSEFVVVFEAGGLKMVRRILVALVVVFASAAVAFAQTQPKIETAPMKRTSAADAPGMFQSYCAACHGKDAKGNGPAAAALKKAPADLTRISARNGGTFPAVKVKRYIEGADEVAAHGTRDMPMWAGLFRSLERDTAAMRVQGLSDYLESLQVK